MTPGELFIAAAEEMVARALDDQERLARHGGVDGLALCSDYCCNGGRPCLCCGNVHCGPMTSGTGEEAAESARYALRHGMPGGGSSSQPAIASTGGRRWSVTG